MFPRHISSQKGLLRQGHWYLMDMCMCLCYADHKYVEYEWCIRSYCPAGNWKNLILEPRIQTDCSHFIHITIHLRNYSTSNNACIGNFCACVFGCLYWSLIFSRATLRWRHNGFDSVSNHQPHHCLLNRLFRRRSKETSKLRVTGLCAENSPGTGEFSAQMASNAESVSIWWRHHDLTDTGAFVWSLQCQWSNAEALHWRHNERDGVSDHLLHDCLLTCLFRHKSKKTSKLRVTGVCEGNSPGPVNSPHKRAVTRKTFPFDDIMGYGSNDLAYDYNKNSRAHILECITYAQGVFLFWFDDGRSRRYPADPCRIIKL